MKEYRIIDYSIEYQQKLKNFLKLHNPSFSDTYIDFLVDNAWNENHEDPAILVVDEEDNIVGEHLFFYTKAKINGTEKNIHWSHDTFLEENARRYAGLDFMLKIYSRNNCVGIGLSEISKKITRKTKGVYWADIYKYFIFNRYFFIATIKHLIGIKPTLHFRQEEKITIKGATFRLGSNIHDIKIPNDGYWGNGSYDIEFIRDENYINKRFFSNPVFHYDVFILETCGKHDEAYFVVRPIIYKGFKALCIVDYRFDTHKEKQLKLLLKAASKLARRNQCGFLFLVASDPFVYRQLGDNPMVVKRQGTFTMPKYQINKDTFDVIATIADPDGEYHL